MKADFPTGDDIDLVFSLGTHGWGDLYVISGNDMRRFEISMVFSDPVGDLIGLSRDLYQGRPACRVYLPKEPGATLIDVTRYEDRHHIVSVKVYDCKDEVKRDPPSGDPVVSFDIRARHLAEILYHQLNKTYSLCRDKSFRRDRDDFPLAEFLALEEVRSETLPAKDED